MRDHTALDTLWRQRLNDARLRLAFAVNYVNEVHRDCSSGEFPAPDSQIAYYQALCAESFALREYRRVLHRFADLVLRSKVPDEQRQSFRR